MVSGSWIREQQNDYASSSFKREAGCSALPRCAVRSVPLQRWGWHAGGCRNGSLPGGSSAEHHHRSVPEEKAPWVYLFFIHSSRFHYLEGSDGHVTRKAISTAPTVLGLEMLWDNSLPSTVASGYMRVLSTCSVTGATDRLNFNLILFSWMEIEIRIATRG